MSDITLKVKVKYSDGEWIASTPVYDITGTGNTPEIALGNFTSALEELYSGDKFLTANNRPVEISHMITGVSADVYLTVKMDRPLSDFGIEVAEEPVVELQPTLKGAEILALPEPEYNPITDYSNCIPEAFALMAMLEIEKGSPIVVEEAEGQCARCQTTLEKVEARYPQIISRFEETRTDPDGSEEEFDMIEFWWGGDWAEELPKQMKKASDQPMDEEEETPSSTTCGKCRHFYHTIGPFESNCEELDVPVSEDGEACKYFEPRIRDDIMACAEAGDSVFGVSLSADEIGAISRDTKTWLIVPANTTHAPQPGRRILTYEKGKRRAFIGRFVVGEVRILERDAAADGEWQIRLNMSEEDITGRFGTSFRVTAIEICDYCEFFMPYPVPEGEKAPRGMTWLSPMYLKALLNPFGVMPKVEEAKE